jgi:tRNA modification GTPase
MNARGHMSLPRDSHRHHPFLTDTHPEMIRMDTQDAKPDTNSPRESRPDTAHGPAKDTIVAVSTPRGYSGIGVIRMTGPDSLSILQRLFESAADRGEFPVRRAVYGTVRDPEAGSVLDDGIALFMRGPSTYTGEDMVELSLHGSPAVLDMVVRCAVRLGARPATGGEFTRRAFLAGKLDLLQAEAVIDLIEATGPCAVREARSRLDKDLSREIGRISGALKDVLAELEAYIDFDEDETEPVPDPIPQVGEILSDMRSLIRDAESGRIRREGVKAVIVGKPNVGKSTLFNALLGTDRTIVTPFAGTTRDTVDERLLLGEVCFVLSDTAGIRTRPEPIEEEGIRRTLEKIADADLVIAVFDGSLPLDEEDEAVVLACEDKNALVAINKLDLRAVVAPDAPKLAALSSERIPLSAKTGIGMEKLLHLLEELGGKLAEPGRSAGEGSLTRRGLLLMEAAVIPLDSLVKGFEREGQASAEIISLEIRRALMLLEEMTGESADEGVLDRIFHRFCVGK